MCHHIIGLLQITEGSELIDIHQLKFHIQERIEHNQDCRKSGLEYLVWPEWTLKDYADRRKATNLCHFIFCPVCGEKIDWKAIRMEANNERTAF